MQIIEGDILQVFDKAKEAYLLHGVSCQPVLHAGLAKQLINKYPALLTQHRKNIQLLGADMLLGTCTFFATDTTGHKTKDIVNLYQQRDVGVGKQQIDYDYFESALQDFRKNLTDGLYALPVYMPYGIGAGLGGGDWSVIEKIIKRVLPKTILVRYEKKRS